MRGPLGRHLNIMQASSLLQNPTTEFPAPGTRPNRVSQSKKLISPYTGRMIPEAVAEVRSTDSRSTKNSRQAAAVIAND